MRAKYKNIILEVDRCEYECKDFDIENNIRVYHVKLMNNSRVIYFEFDTDSDKFFTLFKKGYIDLDGFCNNIKYNPLIIGEEKC